MHLFEENIKDLGLNIPDLPKALANYVPYKLLAKVCISLAKLLFKMVK